MRGVPVESRIRRSVYRVGNVLQVTRAEVVEKEVGLASDLVVDA
jgi:hypothetical protein